MMPERRKIPLEIDEALLQRARERSGKAVGVPIIVAATRQGSRVSDQSQLFGTILGELATKAMVVEASTSPAETASLVTQWIKTHAPLGQIREIEAGVEPGCHTGGFRKYGSSNSTEGTGNHSRLMAHMRTSFSVITMLVALTLVQPVSGQMFCSPGDFNCREVRIPLGGGGGRRPDIKAKLPRGVTVTQGGKTIAIENVEFVTFYQEGSEEDNSIGLTAEEASTLIGFRQAKYGQASDFAVYLPISEIARISRIVGKTESDERIRVTLRNSSQTLPDFYGLERDIELRGVEAGAIGSGDPILGGRSEVRYYGLFGKGRGGISEIAFPPVPSVPIKPTNITATATTFDGLTFQLSDVRMGYTRIGYIRLLRKPGFVVVPTPLSDVARLGHAG